MYYSTIPKNCGCLNLRDDCGVALYECAICVTACSSKCTCERIFKPRPRYFNQAWHAKKTVARWLKVARDLHEQHMKVSIRSFVLYNINVLRVVFFSPCSEWQKLISTECTVVSIPLSCSIHTSDAMIVTRDSFFYNENTYLCKVATCCRLCKLPTPRSRVMTILNSLRG